MPLRVRQLLTAGLASESFYPSSIMPDRVAELRQLEGEKPGYIWQKLQESFEKAGPKDAAIRARPAETSTKVSERLANLFWLDQPNRGCGVKRRPHSPTDEGLKWRDHLTYTPVYGVMYPLVWLPASNCGLGIFASSSSNYGFWMSLRLEDCYRSKSNAKRVGAWHPHLLQRFGGPFGSWSSS
jgi:hypothetical protein